MTPRVLSAVLPFLSALPPGTPVNVNTAPPEVLAAIADNLAGERLEAFVADRARKPFTTVAEFRARLPDGAKLASDFGLAVSSTLLLRDHRGAAGRDAAPARGARAPWRRRAAGDRLAGRRVMFGAGVTRVE